MKILAVFVTVILTILKETSACCYRNNLPPLKCMSDPIAIPGPVCAPPRTNIIPGPCDVPISGPAFRPACVRKEIVNRITLNNCCGSDEVYPFNRFIPNSCPPQCHCHCKKGPIITHSCGSRTSINKVAKQNVIVKNVHANDRCNSVHIEPPQCSSCVSNVWSHYYSADQPIIRSCGCEAPINKVTVRNVIIKNVPMNDFCHCEQKAPPLRPPCISNPAPHLHCAVPPVINRGCGCEAPIRKVTVRNVFAKDIPVNDCRKPASPLRTSYILNPIPHCHFADQPIVSRRCGCEPPINKVALRNVNVNNKPACDCCVKHPPPRCPNIIIPAHQGAPCIPNNFPKVVRIVGSTKPTIFIPDPPCKVPGRTTAVQPDCCGQRDRCCNLNSKCCYNNPCVQCKHCCEQNSCYQKPNCEQRCSKCHRNEFQPPCHTSNCCESDPCCYKPPVRTITIRPNCYCQKDHCCNLNSKRCCDKRYSSCDNCCEKNCYYKKQCCKQCCFNCCHNKSQPSCYNRCRKSDPCCCKKKPVNVSSVNVTLVAATKINMYVIVNK